MEIKTITPLRDITSYDGRGNKRSAPYIITFVGCFAPLLILINLPFSIPLYIIIPVYLWWIIFLIARILGNQSERIKHFKNKVYKNYGSLISMTSTVDIHKNGCVEYMDGSCRYFIIGNSRETFDKIQRAQGVKKVLAELMSSYEIDFIILNVPEGNSLEEDFSKVKMGDRESQKIIQDILEHNIRLVSENTLASDTVYSIKGQMSSYLTMEKRIKEALNKPEAKIFKNLRLASGDEASDIINKEIDGYIDLTVLQEEKYATGDTEGARVVAFYKTKKAIKKEEKKEKPVDTIGFIPS